MAWLQISINTDKQFSEQAEAALHSNGACSVTFSDAADNPILEPAPGETPVWDTVVVTGLFEDTAQEATLIDQISLALKHIDCAISSSPLADQNWTRSWMEHYRPMCFGQRLWVCPWHMDPPDPEAINLRLDPGLAFGTGTHPTTALCLQWLDQNINKQASLLDYGCGSGILAIAALLLGVARADGVDIDPQALEASHVNAEANGVETKLSLYTVEQFNQQTGPDSRQYDIVIANILSGPLVELAPVLASHTCPGGDIVLSGILEDQAANVLAAYANYFDMDTPVVKDEWVLLHGCRKH